MGYKFNWRSMRCIASFFYAALFVGNSHASAPHWQWANEVDAHTIGLFHFDPSSFQKLPATVQIGVDEGTLTDFFINSPSLGSVSNLEFYNFHAANVGILSLTNDVPFAVLGESSLLLDGPVQLRGRLPFGGNGNTLHEGDFTIEAWVKFNHSPNTTDLRLGTSDQILRIVRDPSNYANDKLGYQGTHGAWMPHQGFQGFEELGIVEGEWFHIAMTVHSLGRFFDSQIDDYRYNPGAYASIFVNGFLVGSHMDGEDDDGENHGHITRIPLDGTYPNNITPPYHSTDRLLLRNMNPNSTVLVDEFTVRSQDLTNNGAVTKGLFRNGDPGPASASNWHLYE